MIGLVLVTHGRLADEFKAALEHVMGPQKQIESITIGADDDADLGIAARCLGVGQQHDGLT